MHCVAGFATRVRCALRNSAYLVERLEAHPRCVLLLAPEFINVTFWWVPPRLAHLAHDSPEFLSQIGEVTRIIKSRMMTTGTVLITFVSTPRFPNFWRMVFNDPAVTKADIDFILDELDRLGADL